MLYPPLLLLHVGSGSVGLLSGAVALSLRKGSHPHGVAGVIFFISMLTASAAGALLAIRNAEMDNVFGGILTFLSCGNCMGDRQTQGWGNWQF